MKRCADIDLTVVVPVWNGKERLPRSIETLIAFAESRSRPTELLFVDDHSEPETAAILEQHCAGRDLVTVLRNDRNRGKGYSVAAGMQAARGRFVVFTDADLAYPPEDIERAAHELGDGCDVAVACRVLPESRYLVSPSFFHYFYTRHVLSRLVNRLVRWALVPGLLDTQAGLKGFTRDAAQRVFSRTTVSGFAFDVECLVIARRAGLRVRQIPVLFRYDDEPTSVRFVFDGMRLLRDLAMIGWYDWRRRYG
jgi:dolichyl-phosphate beta-glucosyltransferase